MANNTNITANIVFPHRIRNGGTAFMPDLLILDIEVGKANSLDEIPFIQLNCPSAPIIIVSSHTDGETVDRSYQSGVCQYIKSLTK